MGSNPRSVGLFLGCLIGLTVLAEYSPQAWLVVVVVGVIGYFAWRVRGRITRRS